MLTFTIFLITLKIISQNNLNLTVHTIINYTIRSTKIFIRPKKWKNLLTDSLTTKNFNKLVSPIITMTNFCIYKIFSPKIIQDSPPTTAIPKNHLQAGASQAKMNLNLETITVSLQQAKTGSRAKISTNIRKLPARDLKPVKLRTLRQ